MCLPDREYNCFSGYFRVKPPNAFKTQLEEARCIVMSTNELFVTIPTQFFYRAVSTLVYDCLNVMTRRMVRWR
jgi:hypothetical protein